MIPFARLVQYGNTITRTEYTLSTAANSYLFFDPSTGFLYGRGQNGYEIGYPNNFLAYNTFVRTATNVKRILSTRNGGSNFHAYLSNDNKIYFAGNDACVKGSTPSSTNYNGWTDSTVMFTNAGINPDDIKEIQGFYNLKLNVVMKNGDLYCAGKNNISTASSFGTGNNNDSNYTLVKVPISNVKSADGNLYVTNDGNLFTTGTNAKFQYGNGGTTSSPNLSQIVFGSVVDAWQGHQSSYFLDTDGVVRGCGTQFGTQYGNEFGTGTGGPFTYTSYVIMHTEVDVFNICRGNMSSVLISDDELWSTGLNNGGTFGNGDSNNTYTWSKAIGEIKINASMSSTIMRANSNTMVLNDNKLYQAGSGYGTGSGSNTTYISVPLTFLL